MWNVMCDVPHVGGNVTCMSKQDLPHVVELVEMVRLAGCQAVAEDYGVKHGLIESRLREAGYTVRGRHHGDDDPGTVSPPIPGNSRIAPRGSSSVCAQTDPDLWFPEKGGSNTLAKRLCATCPSRVRKRCMEWALVNEESGVWGGTSEQERREIRDERAKEQAWREAKERAWAVSA